MAPKRGRPPVQAKRTLDDDMTCLDSAVKKHRKQMEDQLTEVLNALGDSLDHQMLRVMARGSLTSPQSEPRHRAQAAVAEMISAVLAETEAEMLKNVETRKTCPKKLEATYHAAQEAFEAMKVKWSEDNLAMRAAGRAKNLAAAQSAGPGGPAAVRQMTALSTAVDRALREHYPRLASGGLSAVELNRQLRILTDLLSAPPTGVGVEESLAKAFPVAALKKPQERGAFDKNVMEMIRGELEKHLGRLLVRVAEVAVEAQELEAAEAAATEALDRARERMAATARALLHAELDYREAGDDILHQEIAEEDQQRSIEEFRSGHIAALGELRNRNVQVPAGFSISWWEEKKRVAAAEVIAAAAAVPSG